MNVTGPSRFGSILALLGWSLVGVARGQVVTEFAIPTADSQPFGIVLGPDGNLWFTEQNRNKIGRITTAGVITEFPIPAASSNPSGIASGPDGSIWFTERLAGKIGRITTVGVITEFPIPTAGSNPVGIAVGPDGNLWFVEQGANQIGRITTAGAITEFPIPTANSQPYGIAASSDDSHSLWFTESNTDQIGQITTAGVITEFPIPTADSDPVGIAVAPDGFLWFTEYNANQIGRIGTWGGGIDEFPILTTGSVPSGIAAGPDGNLWFTEFNANQIGRITPSGIITEFPIPTASSSPFGIAAGPDGNLWFVERFANQIGRITTASFVPEPMAVDAHAVTGTNSNANGVLEAGETVEVAPSWKNTLTISQSLIGTASDLFGQPGPTYTIDDSSADYGIVSGGETAGCDSPTGDCYRMTVSGPRTDFHWDATFTEDLGSSSIPRIRTLHVGQSYVDVPTSDPFYGFIENLFHNQVLGSCVPGQVPGYACPGAAVSRAQMAVFLLKGKLGGRSVPPPATGTVFNDVNVEHPFAPWIEQLAAFRITGGCGGGSYCPSNAVTRAQMAVFLLKAEHGSAYTPPPCAGIFGDVTCPSAFADWIEQLATEGITGGCGGGNYCPNNPILRRQMAVFLVKAFGLRLYGP